MMQHQLSNSVCRNPTCIVLINFMLRRTVHLLLYKTIITLNIPSLLSLKLIWNLTFPYSFTLLIVRVHDLSHELCHIYIYDIWLVRIKLHQKHCNYLRANHRCMVSMLQDEDFLLKIIHMYLMEAEATRHQRTHNCWERIEEYHQLIPWRQKIYVTYY